ncbi:S-layer family protein [Cohnella sp. SGD-V74]|nr:S-layer family protein [Cohnella sp. SGD-V74]
MIARAMSLTGLKAAQTDGADASVAFTDAEEVSGYARSGVAAAIRAGVVTGKSGGRLEPKAFVTRAEVAAIVKRLLEKSNLI